MAVIDRPIVRLYGDNRQRRTLGEIGNTPILEISYGTSAPIFAKAEYLNPTGSHKDRAYLRMIREMEAAGLIKRGMTLVDYTTGNSGAGLAFIGRELGYNVIVTMPEDMTNERKKQIRSYGADLVLTPATDFVKGARVKAEEIVLASADRVLINQSDNQANVEAFKDFAIELLSQIEQRIGYFIAAIGTGASISGAAAILKQADASTQVVGYEARESPSSSATKRHVSFSHGRHNLVGTSPGRVASNTNLGLIDRVELIGDSEIKEGERLLEACGLSLGRTSAASLYLAKEIASSSTDGDPVATIFYDTGWKYPGYLKDLK